MVQFQPGSGVDGSGMAQSRVWLNTAGSNEAPERCNPVSRCSDWRRVTARTDPSPRAPARKLPARRHRKVCVAASARRLCAGLRALIRLISLQLGRRLYNICARCRLKLPQIADTGPAARNSANPRRAGSPRVPATASTWRDGVHTSTRSRAIPLPGRRPPSRRWSRSNGRRLRPSIASGTLWPPARPASTADCFSDCCLILSGPSRLPPQCRKTRSLGCIATSQSAERRFDVSYFPFNAAIAARRDYIAASAPARPAGCVKPVAASATALAASGPARAAQAPAGGVG